MFKNVSEVITGGVAERLVYADVLEERGDPLAEWIRLACEDNAEQLKRTPGTRAYCSSPRARALRQAILTPLLSTIDAACTKCLACAGYATKKAALVNVQPTYTHLVQASPVWDVCTTLCRYCGGTGRFTRLWRTCDFCGGDGKDIPSLLMKQLEQAPVCRVCSGSGKLLSGPLQTLYEVLALVYSPEAAYIRIGDMSVVFRLCAEVGA